MIAAKTEDLDWNLRDKLLQTIWIKKEQQENIPKQIKKIEKRRIFEWFEEYVRMSSLGEFSKLTSENWRSTELGIAALVIGRQLEAGRLESTWLWTGVSERELESFSGDKSVESL